MKSYHQHRQTGSRAVKFTTGSPPPKGSPLAYIKPRYRQIPIFHGSNPENPLIDSVHRSAPTYGGETLRNRTWKRHSKTKK
jgi:hypothetical protein